jgi:hypothetical protein
MFSSLIKIRNNVIFIQIVIISEIVNPSFPRFELLNVLLLHWLFTDFGTVFLFNWFRVPSPQEK